MKKVWSACCLSVLLMTQVAWGQSLELKVPEVSVPPVLDGVADDVAWEQVKPLPIADKASGMTILLKAVRSADMVYFHVLYLDAVQNFMHKPWEWNAEKNEYEEGAEREDTFVFKWDMTGRDVDLSNFSEDSYTADVWYWKANRTNPAGYADDKRQILGDSPGKKSAETVSASGKKRYLQRKSDKGSPPYREVTPGEFAGQRLNRYLPKEPEGSRGDVQAKGVWNNGTWNIEFARKLKTGHDDDVQFDPASGKRYKFGVSIYSLYGRTGEADGKNFYGLGRISDPIYLSF